MCHCVCVCVSTCRFICLMMYKYFKSWNKDMTFRWCYSFTLIIVLIFSIKAEAWAVINVSVRNSNMVKWRNLWINIRPQRMKNSHFCPQATGSLSDKWSQRSEIWFITKLPYFHKGNSFLIRKKIHDIYFPSFLNISGFCAAVLLHHHIKLLKSSRTQMKLWIFVCHVIEMWLFEYNMQNDNQENIKFYWMPWGPQTQNPVQTPP